ncbi:uncharacterized protein N7483_005358 [Penicillium malachiteum]|uniref:uncharacterized protein n=1 Tax=Penicillium malachiteum TaxID=1324776 RepID=UPI002546AC70|nr:uncharacterized protein N7483_005358 [Penicillium malachiteum]KAJ5730850.1 hypothetical protein N7483_005358 [Penicillium malachiteum]
MTSDKQNNGYPAKPFTPTLSAAFHRSSKAPLTPKLASPSPGNPVARRLAHPDQTHPYSTPSKEDVPPVPAVTPSFLSANVTPRSGSRSTRRDVGFSSPSNTPVPSPQAPYIQQNVGLRAERRTANGAQPGSRGEAGTTPEPESKDTRVRWTSDARSSNSSDAELPRPKQGRMSPASSFLYANGDQERYSSTDESQISAAPARRAGTLPRAAPTTRPGTLPSQRLKSPRVSDATAPPILESHSTQGPSSEKGIENVLHRYGSPPSTISERPPLLTIGKHRKSSSVDSNNQSIHPRDALRASPVIIPNNTRTDAPALMPILTDQVPNLRPRVFSNGSSVSTDTHQQIPMSPGKSDSGDGALNARTERKILDLEISNSSLLAINRTLEREMRKQNAELRRFRRLSRSGRLSMAPSTRSFSGTALSITSEAEEDASASDHSSAPSDDMSDFNDEDSVPEGVLSPDTLAEHDAKHRAHDEKRFMIDLANHQNLLVESQKMNQSLKKCLIRTEELIKAGRKALEYNVHVQDIELGGRVLCPEELDDMGENRRGLLSPSTDYSSFMPSPSISFDDSEFTEAASFPLPSSPGGTD